MTEAAPKKRRPGRPKQIDSPDWRQVAAAIYRERAAAAKPPASMGRPRLANIGKTEQGDYVIPIAQISDDADVLMAQNKTLTRRAAMRQALREIMRQAGIVPRGFSAILANCIRLDQMRRKIPAK